MIELDWQLRFLQFLQVGRGPFVDAFFRFLNLFDTDYFACTLIAFIWIGCSWRWGSRLAFLFVVSGLLNSWAKLAFSLPRPFLYDPTLNLVTLHDYGFPSGGAQNAMLLGCLIAYYWKSRWALPAGIFYIALISFSRLFLGVHFPVDVLGGWVIGACIFYAFIKVHSSIERFAADRPRMTLALTLAAALMLGLLLPDFKTIFLVFSATPIAIGIYFSTRYDLYISAPQPFKKQVLLGLFGVVTAFGVALSMRLFPLDPLPSVMLQVTMAGLWISLLASPVCLMIFLRQR